MTTGTKTLPIQAIKVIRSLKLNHKKRRHLYTNHKRQRLRPTKSHKDNLITIKRGSNKTDTNLIISTCNIQSVRNKDLQVSDLLNDYSIDILALMETWLTANQRDDQWLQTTPINRDPYRIHVHNRKDRGGRGIALITKNTFTTQLKNSGSYDSFEYATWEVSIKCKTITLTVVYHPLYSLKK